MQKCGGRGLKMQFGPPLETFEQTSGASTGEILSKVAHFP
jgi:hypothetical protein